MGTLHVVATPIGNLEDVTLRALRVIGEADLLFAEDTRRTRKLLERHGIDARPLSLHAHNEQSRVDRALEALAGDGRVALVSDAGTPLVSDPGERLVAAAIAAGHRVEAVPGASAILAALAVAGLSPEPFTFLGFLPRRAGARKQVLEAYRNRAETLVLFESPKRIEKTLAELAEALGDRRACVARELTKMHEEARRGRLSELVDHYAGGVLGEITVVVEGATEVPATLEESEVDAEIRARIRAGERPKDIAAALAAPTGWAKRDLYARALALRTEGA
ncbi:MAG: 16S rRNA (cytidine(1402)-2'-O)-methyltransferase [Myxococcota bacterium]